MRSTYIHSSTDFDYITADGAKVFPSQATKLHFISYGAAVSYFRPCYSNDIPPLLIYDHVYYAPIFAFNAFLKYQAPNPRIDPRRNLAPNLTLSNRPHHPTHFQKAEFNVCRHRRFRTCWFSFVFVRRDRRLIQRVQTCLH